jgi:hypothetical protein
LNYERVCQNVRQQKKKRTTHDPVSEVLKLFSRIELLLRKNIYKNQTGQRVSPSGMRRPTYW